MMKPTDFLLILIDTCGGSIHGRTLLQKKTYFVSVLSGVKVDLGFGAHYYGPFSEIVEGTAIQLKNLGFLQESETGFGLVSGGFEVKRYDYALTEGGRKLVESLKALPEYDAVHVAVNKINNAGDPNYVELSIAAKSYFLLKRNGSAMTVAELQGEAEKYDWRISPKSIEHAMSFLEKVGLTKLQ